MEFSRLYLDSPSFCHILEALSRQWVGKTVGLTSFVTSLIDHYPFLSDIQCFKIHVSNILFSSVQFSHSVMSNSLQPHESQHFRRPCPSPTPGVHSDSRPLSQWCHPAISSSVVPFFCPQSLPASESFPMRQLFAWGGQSTGVSASVSLLLLISGRRVNLVPVIPSWLEAEILFYIFNVDNNRLKNFFSYTNNDSMYTFHIFKPKLSFN